MTINKRLFIKIRSNYTRSIIFILFCLFCHVPYSIIAQDNYTIRKIKFKGNSTFGKSDLLNYTYMQPSNIYTRIIQKKEVTLYSEEFMETDLEQLTRFYQSEGFLHAEVKVDTLKLKETKKKQKVDIYIRIKENDYVSIDTISVHINGHLAGINPDSLTKGIIKTLNLRSKKRFTDNTLYNDVAIINDHFMNLGYVYVKTDYNLNLKAPSNKVGISYTVTPGNTCQFGETSIGGNKHIKEKFIRKQLAYSSTQTYSKAKLDKTRKRLYNLQLFRIVSITSQINKETEQNPIPIQIQIEEMPRWMTRFGIGYGTEDKFRAFADVTYRGLFGGTSRLNLYAKHSALTPYYVSLSWVEPQFFVRNLSLSVNPYIERQNEPGYNTQTLGINFPISYSITDQMQVSLTYYLQKVTQHVESDDAEIPNPEDDKFLYSKSGLSALYVFNNAQPVYSPEKGWSVSLGGKINGYIFGTDFDYTKVWTDIRRYQPIGKFILSLRAMIGGIYSSNSDGFIPVEDRFYSGGSTSNRGWGRSELGPKRESGTPLGGKSIIEMNVEIRRHIFWRIELAAFLDMGNVWEEAYHYRFNELAYAVGGGIRINTPIGPIRLDIGVPIANANKTVHFFLSVGQAF